MASPPSTRALSGAVEPAAPAQRRQQPGPDAQRSDSDHRADRQRAPRPAARSRISAVTGWSVLEGVAQARRRAVPDARAGGVVAAGDQPVQEVQVLRRRAARPGPSLSGPRQPVRGAALAAGQLRRVGRRQVEQRVDHRRQRQQHRPPRRRSGGPGSRSRARTSAVCRGCAGRAPRGPRRPARERQQGEEQQAAGDEHVHHVGPEPGRGGGQHLAPRRGRRPNADAEEGQRRPRRSCWSAAAARRRSCTGAARPGRISRRAIRAAAARRRAGRRPRSPGCAGTASGRG